MQLLWAAWTTLQAVLYLSPPNKAAPIPSLPHLDLHITPTWRDSVGTSLRTRMTIESPSILPGQAFLEMILEVGRVPSMNYTESSRILAEDEEGSFELLIDDGAWPIRRWSTERETKGDVRLDFIAYPRYTTKATPPGPRSDIRENSGGLLGTGNVFVPTLLPFSSASPPADVKTTMYNITVNWDLSETPSELAAQTVWTYGEGLTNTRIGPSSDMVNTMYAVAPNASFHSYHDPALPNYGLYWLTPPSPYALPSPDKLGERIASLLPIMSTFFSNKTNAAPASDLTYRVFLRESPRGHGGSAFDWSFLLEWDEDVRLGTEEEAREESYHLVAHEMVHNWPSMEAAPGGQEDANATWYEEGER